MFAQETLNDCKVRTQSTVIELDGEKKSRMIVKEIECSTGFFFTCIGNGRRGGTCFPGSPWNAGGRSCQETIIFPEGLDACIE